MLFRTVLQQESDQSKNFFIPSIYFNSVVIGFQEMYVYNVIVLYLCKMSVN